MQTRAQEIDTDHDEAISKAEWKTAMQQFQERHRESSSGRSRPGQRNRDRLNDNSKPERPAPEDNTESDDNADGYISSVFA